MIQEIAGTPLNAYPLCDSRRLSFRCYEHEFVVADGSIDYREIGKGGGRVGPKLGLGLALQRVGCAAS